MKKTEKHKHYWRDRKIDWTKQYLSTWDHPHRHLIAAALQSFNWFSLWEVGCGPGANLIQILKQTPNKQLGGSDINADAIALAKTTFKEGRFHVESGDNMLLSDKSVDVVLADAALLYVAPKDIQRFLGEMVRVARNRIVLCEFHSKSWWSRLWLRYKTGYNAYDYSKELEEAGCFDIQVYKIPTEYWPGFPWQKYGYIILARVAK